MITKNQADRLKRLAYAFAEASADAAFAGANEPDGAYVLRAELRAAKAELDLYIKSLESHDQPTPIAR